ncbi:MAG TPA: 2TM domain-containing protein [Polyangiaceae bacterium]
MLTDPVDRAALERAGVSPAVARVVLRALEKKPERRFASMDELRSALESAERGESPLELALAESAVSTTMAQQFSTSEVNEVLGRAIEQQAARQNSTKLGFDDLIAIAAEVGVDVESLREASRALRSGAEERQTALANTTQRDAWLRQQRLTFYRHAGIYAIVNAAILVIGLLLLSFTPWWLWFLPALAWGVGVAIHGLIAFTSNEHDWTEHQNSMQWWLDQKRPPELSSAGATDAQARDRGPREASRRRFEPALEAEKLRVATDLAGTPATKVEDLGDEDARNDPPAVKRRKH